MTELKNEGRNMKLQTSLVILMGLPGSGKSSLAQKIEEEINLNRSNTNQSFAVIVKYDDFIPLEIQSKFPEEATKSSSCSSLAKLCRKNFVDSVKFIVDQCTDEHFLNVSFSEESIERQLTFSSLGVEEEEELVSKSLFVAKVKDTLETVLVKCKSPQVVSNLVVIIDDNNYYSSMREEFYQIAKVRRTGFCVIYCKTSIQTCRKRNSKRSETTSVPDKVIIEMSLKLEPPNPMKYACDVFSIEIPEVVEGDNANESESHNKSSDNNIPLVVQVIESSLKNPVDWSPPPNRLEEIERERKICSESEVHQADLILRKWISKEMGLKFVGISSQKSAAGSSKANFSKELRKQKELMLEKLRLGELTLKSSPAQDVEFQQEVVQLFQSMSLS